MRFKAEARADKVVARRGRIAFIEYEVNDWSPPYIMPAAPADGRWVVQAIFDEPGTYVLRAIAADGALFTGQNVTVSVSP